MSAHIIIKVYGNIWPCTQNLVEALRPLMPFSEQHLEIIDFENNMLRISYEGMYFPLDEVLPIIESFLQEDSQGKLDYIDLEEWKLYRHEIKGKEIVVKKSSLNQVLDFSGF